MNKFYIIIACFTLAIIGGSLFTFPKYQAIDTYRNQIERTQQRIIIARADAELFQRYRRKIEQDFKEELEKIDTSIPDDVDLLSLFNFLQEAAAHRGLRLIQIDSFSTHQVTETIKGTSITFSISGPYFHFKEFLRHLSQSARLINVQSISFASAEEEEDFGFSLTIKVYSY